MACWEYFLVVSCGDDIDALVKRIKVQVIDDRACKLINGVVIADTSRCVFDTKHASLVWEMMPRPENEHLDPMNSIVDGKPEIQLSITTTLSTG